MAVLQPAASSRDASNETKTKHRQQATLFAQVSRAIAKSMQIVGLVFWCIFPILSVGRHSAAMPRKRHYKRVSIVSTVIVQENTRRTCPLLSHVSRVGPQANGVGLLCQINVTHVRHSVVHFQAGLRVPGNA